MVERTARTTGPPTNIPHHPSDPIMPDIIPLNSAAEINAARQAFEQHVTSAVYRSDFAAIGQAFQLTSLIGKRQYIYVKCVDEAGHVVGMAYGWREPDENGTSFFIQDIISASGSHSGSAMVNWFADRGHVGMRNLIALRLTAANEGLKAMYQKPHYGFTPDPKGGSSMSRPVR